MEAPCNLRRIGATRTVLGEGIRYDAESDMLSWLDIPQSASWTFGPEAREVEGTLGPEAAFACLTEDGRWLAGCDGGFYLDSIATGRDILTGAGVLNDGAVHPSGEFLLFGSRHRPEETPRGHMWCLGRALTRLPWSLTVFNGPAFSPDGSKTYFADSPARTIYVADVDAEHQTLGKREIFAVVSEPLGYPDGMICDDKGGVWSAHWDGGCVTRYHPCGGVDFRIQLPIARPTSLAFKGST